MTLNIALPDANWLTLVPAAGLTRRGIGVPEGIWFGTTDTSGDASGGVIDLDWVLTFDIKDRWVFEWRAVSAAQKLHTGNALTAFLAIATGPAVPDPLATGTLTNPSFHQIKNGVPSAGAGVETFDFDLGSAGGRPLLTWGTKTIPGDYDVVRFVWSENNNTFGYTLTAWGYYYAQQGLFRGLPPGQG